MAKLMEKSMKKCTDKASYERQQFLEDEFLADGPPKLTEDPPHTVRIPLLCDLLQHRTIAEDRIKQGYGIGKNLPGIYFAICDNNIWSYLLWSPVIGCFGIIQFGWVIKILETDNNEQLIGLTGEAGVAHFANQPTQ